LKFAVSGTDTGGTLLKGCGVKQVLWAQISLFSEIMVLFFQTFLSNYSDPKLFSIK
jgi:hypothetical protein